MQNATQKSRRKYDKRKRNEKNERMKRNIYRGKHLGKRGSRSTTLTIIEKAGDRTKTIVVLLSSSCTNNLVSSHSGFATKGSNLGLELGLSVLGESIALASSSPHVPILSKLRSGIALAVHLAVEGAVGGLVTKLATSATLEIAEGVDDCVQSVDSVCRKKISAEGMGGNRSGLVCPGILGGFEGGLKNCLDNLLAGTFVGVVGDPI